MLNWRYPRLTIPDGGDSRGRELCGEHDGVKQCQSGAYVDQRHQGYQYRAQNAI